MVPRICILTTLVFFTINVFGQKGFYFIKNYTPQDYFSEYFSTSPQNWAFIQNRSGDVLVGNTSGVFLIENEKITLISETSNKRFLAFAKSSSGVIYCGGSDLGYIGYDSVSNQAQFKSIVDHLPPEYKGFDPIKNTIAFEDRIYFKSENYLFMWTGKQFKTWTTNSKFLEIFMLGSVMHIQQENLGLFSLRNDSMVRVIQPEIIPNVEIIAATYNHNINNPGDLLVITKRHGLYTLDSLKLHQVDIKGLKKTVIIRDALELNDNNIALATDQNGVVIIDRTGELRNIINTNRGLHNNTINGIYQTGQGGIWIGMNKGFAHLEYPISTSYFNEENGLEGIVYNILSNDEHLYVATNTGLYESNRIKEELKFVKRFKEIEESWDLLKLENNVMVAATSGVYLVREESIEKVSDENARNIHRSKSNPKLFLIGLKNGLGILQLSDGEWSWEGKVNGIEHEVRWIVEDTYSKFWVGYDQISRLSFENESYSEPEIENFTSREGFLDSLGIFEATFVNERVVFGTDAGIYNFNEPAYRLRPDTTFGKQFSDGSRYVFAISQDKFNNIWFTSNGQNGKVNKSQNGIYQWDSLSLSRIPRTDTWTIYPDDQGIIWLGTTDGLYRYDPNVEKDFTVPFYTSIRSIKLSGDSTIFHGAFPDEDGLASNIQPEDYIYSFPHQNRDISFEYAATSYDYPEKLQYSYWLEGYDQDWSPWTSETKKEYTSLWERDYTFRVRSKNVYGTIGNEATYQFSILPPIYRTWWAYTLGAIVLVGLIFSYTRYRVNKHKKALAKERLLIEKLRHTDQLKDTFLANTSHELRTPLTGIIGIAESLKDGVAGEPTEKMKANLSMLVASGKRLSSLVNSILDFSKLKTHDLHLEQRPTDLKSIVSVVLKMSEPLISGKDLILKNEIAEDMRAVMADEDRLQQILHNLIGNAVKFTEKGVVTISAEDRKDLVAISITDTGIGIPEEKIDFIFKEFEQVDASTTRQFVGTGLGLSITKQLVELHGGTIEVKTKIGEGSTFTFTLPVSKKKAMPVVAALEVAKVKQDLDGHQAVSLAEDDQNGTGLLKILVVDDEPVNQTVLANFLSSGLFAITPALNGAEALAALEKQKFDLVLLDIMMPKMSGFEVCQKIREKFLPNELPVIMITAKNQVSDLVEGLSTGANDYITKPFSKDEFLARVKTHLNLFKINTAYGRFVPHEFLKALGRESIIDVKLGDQVQGEVTVFFSDIRGYSSLSEGMTPEDNFNFLNAYLSRVGPIIKKHNGFVNQFLGDGVMALFRHSAEDALKAAIAIQREVVVYNQLRIKQGREPLEVGIGLHTGSLMLGIIGDQERMDAGVVSDTVNTASRMEGLTKHYGASIVMSKSTLEQLPDTHKYNYRGLGQVQVKGKAKAVNIYEFYDGEALEVIALKQKTQTVFETGLNYYYQKDFTSAATAFKAVLKLIPNDKAAQLYLKRSAEYMVHGVAADWTGVEAMNSK